MFNSICDFFYMGGHGCYIFSAYGSVLVLLSLQWFFTWRRKKPSLRARAQRGRINPGFALNDKIYE